MSVMRRVHDDADLELPGFTPADDTVRCHVATAVGDEPPAPRPELDRWTLELPLSAPQ